MAKKPGQQLNTQQSGITELKQRLFYVVIALLVFRFGSFVPVPGVDPSVLAAFLNKDSTGVTGMLNMFSGGALHRASILSLGIMPYISSSIIIQLFSTIHPALAELKKDGEHGRKKISQYTRYGTLLLALIQGVGMATALPHLIPNLVVNPGFEFYVVAITSLVTGTMFLMWLGEQITERGIGNGISLIIFVGIAANLPASIGQISMQASQGTLSIISMLFIFLLVVGIVFFVVFMERGQRRIVVNYAKRQEGRKVFAAQSTHLPLKINMAGVIPAIFASSIILFPSTLAHWFGQQQGFRWLENVSLALTQGQPLYIMLYVSAIVFFSFFYTAMVFNPRETADNLKKSGAFIPGIRPGEQTSKFIDKVMTRLTLVGALYITFVCLVPQFIMVTWKVNLYLGGTSILIAVVVIMDFMAQVQTLLMSQNYESVLKKANLKNYGAR